MEHMALENVSGTIKKDRVLYDVVPVAAENPCFCVVCMLCLTTTLIAAGIIT